VLTPFPPVLVWLVVRKISEEFIEGLVWQTGGPVSQCGTAGYMSLCGTAQTAAKIFAPVVNQPGRSRRVYGDGTFCGIGGSA
jgi:hypothetical protein